MELERQAERRARSEALVFSGHRFSPAAPFFAVPSWWRRFMFVILSPREVTLYCYICSQANAQGLAWPTYDNIRADLNISNRSVIARTISGLVNKGFLLQEHSAPIASKHRRNVFQRPSVAFTLRELLIKGYIDGDLRPLIPPQKRAAVKKDRASRNEGAIWYALHRMLGHDNYLKYYGTPLKDRGSVLSIMLREQVEQERLAFADVLVARASSVSTPQVMSPAAGGEELSFETLGEAVDAGAIDESTFSEFFQAFFDREKQPDRVEDAGRTNESGSGPARRRSSVTSRGRQ